MLSDPAAPASSGLVLELFGQRVELKGDLPAWLMRDMADLRVPSGDPPELDIGIWNEPEGWMITPPSPAVPVECIPSSELSTTLITALNRLALDSDPLRLHLHSACVERRDDGVLLAGRSESGKTTLTAALLGRGCAYLSDEMVPIDEGWPATQAYPKPLTLKGWAAEQFGDAKGGGGPGRRSEVPASRLGTASAWTVPRIVVFPTFRDGARTVVDQVGASEAAHALLENTFDAGRYGLSSLGALVELVARASCWRLVYSDVDAAADLVMGLPARDVPLDRRLVASEFGHGQTRRTAVDGQMLALDLRSMTLRTESDPPTGAAPARRGPVGDSDDASLVLQAFCEEVSDTAKRILILCGAEGSEIELPDDQNSKGAWISLALDMGQGFGLWEYTAGAMRECHGEDRLHPNWLTWCEEMWATSRPVRNGPWVRAAAPAEHLVIRCVVARSGVGADLRAALLSTRIQDAHFGRGLEVASRWGVLGPVSDSLRCCAARYGPLPPRLDLQLRRSRVGI